MKDEEGGGPIRRYVLEKRALRLAEGLPSSRWDTPAPLMRLGEDRRLLHQQTDATEGARAQTLHGGLGLSILGDGPRTAYEVREGSPLCPITGEPTKRGLLLAHVIPAYDLDPARGGSGGEELVRAMAEGPGLLGPLADEVVRLRRERNRLEGRVERLEGKMEEAGIDVPS